MGVQVAGDIAISTVAGNTGDIDVVPHPLERLDLIGAGGITQDNCLVMESLGFRNETAAVGIAHWFFLNGSGDVLGGIG